MACPIFQNRPSNFSRRYQFARDLIDKQSPHFRDDIDGRLFDGCAALIGFTGEISFEGQAAIWLEQLAQFASDVEAYPFPVDVRRSISARCFARLLRIACAKTGPCQNRARFFTKASLRDYVPPQAHCAPHITRIRSISPAAFSKTICCFRTSSRWPILHLASGPTPPCRRMMAA